MRKILKQDLSGNELDAKDKAEYTWAKDEIAWLFNVHQRVVVKVQFTGNNWLIGNKWGRTKIYEYKCLEVSNGKEANTYGGNGISQDSEETFFTTKLEAINLGHNIISNTFTDAIDTFTKDSESLFNYKNKAE